MKLTHAPDYSIRLIKEGTSDEAPLCEVMISNVATGKFLEGAVFEAALKWQDYIVLFITDDVPFEEGLNIYLLDSRLNVVDSAKMYFIYSPGIFSNLDLSADDTVRFSFFGDEVSMLRLYEKKKFAIPILSTPLGVHHRLTFFRRFEISRLSPVTRSAEEPVELKQ